MAQNGDDVFAKLFTTKDGGQMLYQTLCDDDEEYYAIEAKTRYKGAYLTLKLDYMQKEKRDSKFMEINQEDAERTRDIILSSLFKDTQW